MSGYTGWEQPGYGKRIRKKNKEEKEVERREKDGKERKGKKWDGKKGKNGRRKIVICGRCGKPHRGEHLGSRRIGN